MSTEFVDSDDDELVDPGSYTAPVSAVRTSPRRHPTAPIVATGASGAAAALPAAAAGKKKGKPKARKKTAITKPRGFNYTDEEMVFLLESVRLKLPIGKACWESIAALHTEHPVYGKRGRTHELLRAKFMRLVNTKKPSGDADIPDDVREAKSIMEMMTRKADAGVDVDDDELGPSDEDDRSEVQDDNDERVALEPRRLLTTPRAGPRTNSTGTAQEQLMQLMIMQQTERMNRTVNPEPEGGSAAQLTQLLIAQLQQQQRALDRIMDRLDQIDK